MGKSKLGLFLAVGAAAGYAASLFVSPKTRKAHKQKLEATIDDLANRFLTDANKQELLQIINKAGKEGQTHIKNLSKLLAKNLAAANQTLEYIDKDQYMKAVEKTIKDLKDKKQLNSDQLKKLKTYLQTDYHRFITIRENTK